MDSVMEVISKYWGYIVLLMTICSFILGVIRKLWVKMKALKMGMLALLRAQIVSEYNRYNDKGYCPIYARENIEHLYEQYRLFGGNGTIKELYGKLQELPTDPED